MARPFIKWAGGKRQLLPRLRERMPESHGRYIEPFIGGGALLLDLEPAHATICDANPELANAWLCVRDHADELKEALREHERANSEEHYLEVRSLDRERQAKDKDGKTIKKPDGEPVMEIPLETMGDVERAARFIYLIKAGFNGIWRVNAKGQNNVPYGEPKSQRDKKGYTPKRLDLVSAIAPVHEYLAGNDIEILCGDYSTATARAEAGDLVYLDPPYVPAAPTASFTAYTKGGFGLDQQERLRDEALRLAAEGVSVMLSNSDTKIVRDLYSDPTFHIWPVTARRAINSKADKRGKVGEVIITTYDPPAPPDDDDQPQGDGKGKGK